MRWFRNIQRCDAHEKANREGFNDFKSFNVKILEFTCKLTFENEYLPAGFGLEMGLG